MKAVTVSVYFPCNRGSWSSGLDFPDCPLHRMIKMQLLLHKHKGIGAKSSHLRNPAAAPGACSAASLLTPKMLWNGKTNHEGRFAADSWGKEGIFLLS